MAKKTEEEKFWEDLGYLPVAEQQAILAENGIGGFGGFEGFGGGEEPVFDTGMESSMFSGMANIPEYTSKGALDPFDLTQAAKRVNYAQDLSGLSVDNVFSMMGGPGSYDVNAFSPQMEYGKEITRPGRDRLTSYARKPGWEGYIANEMLNGASESSAIASLQKFLEDTDPNDPELSDDERTQYESLTNSLPRSRDTGGSPSERKEQGFWGDYDYDRILNRATDFADEVFKDPLGWEDPTTGRFYDAEPEEIKTDQMKWFDKYGLPYPTASYEDPKYLEAMLDAEEGTDTGYREAEAQDFMRGSQGAIDKTKAAERFMTEQNQRDLGMQRAWETTQRYNQPPTSKPLTTMIPGRAATPGMPAGPPTTSGTAMFGQLMGQGGGPMAAGAPTQPGRPAVPGMPATGPREITIPGVNVPQGAFRSPNSMLGRAPIIRTLPTGEQGIVPVGDSSPTGFGGGGPAFGELDMWQALKGNTRGIISDFAVKGSKDREMTAKDVDVRKQRERSGEYYRKAQAARKAQSDREASDPRLNDLKQAGALYAMAKNGRNPLQDALAQRRAFARQMGLQMAQSPLAIANAPGARRGVVVYRPSAQRPVAPTRRTGGPTRSATRQTGEVDWNALKAKALTTKAAQAKQSKAAQKQAEDEAYEDASMWGKGLGMVIGNPIVKHGVLKPLGALGTLGRGVVYGIEEAAEGMEDAPDWLKRVVGMTPAAPILGMVDTERTNADDRSFYEKVVSPTSDYGFGQLLDPDNPGWANKALGFLGDIGTDPLTYVTGGATRLAGAMGKVGKLDDAARIVAKGDDFASKAAMAARVGNPDEAARIGRLAAEQQAIGRRLTAEAEALPDFKVPLRQGRKAREAFLAELADTNPDALTGASGKALTRGAERGFNTVTDPALRKMLGLTEPSLRFMGAEIPKTAGIVRRGAQAGGVARHAMNRAPVLGSTMARFTPRGLEEASGVLSRGKQGDVLRAATTVRIQNLMRRGAGTMEARGNRELQGLIRSMKKNYGNDEIKALFRQAEADDVPNQFNKFYKSLTEIYERVSGKPIDFKIDENNYVPHMMTPQFKRFLRENVDNQTVEDMGFLADDLLEGSQYLEKSRKLRPDQRGTPKEFEIGDRKITLNDGTIDELNSELRAAFPEFKGKAYMDDPAVIGEAYVSSISRQAGRDFALERIAKSPNPLVHKVAGELLEAVETRNKFLRQNPVVEKVKQGYTKGQKLVPAQLKGDMPTTPYDDMFATTKHVEETQAQRNLAMKEGKNWVSVVSKDIATQREGLTGTLKTLRTTLMDGLAKKAKSASSQIKTIDSALNQLDAEIKKLGPLTTQNVDEMVAISSTIDAQIRTVKAEIKKIRDQYGKKIPRDKKRLEAELSKVLRGLEGEADDVRQQYAKGAYDMRKEAAERKEMLEKPIREAEKELEQAKAKHGEPPVSHAQTQEAERYLANTYALDEAYEADRDVFIQALNTMVENNIPIYRRVNGRLTPESADTVQQVAAEIRKVEAPVPPAAAAVPAAPAVAAPTPGPIHIPEEVAQARGTAVPTGPTPEQYAEGRDVMSNALLDIVDEANLDQVDAIYTLSDRDTAQLVGEMWDTLPPGAQQRLQELGFTPGAAPEQLALPSATPEVNQLGVAQAPEPAPEVAALQAQKRDAEVRYRDAVADGDENLAAEIEDQLDDLQEQIDTARTGAGPEPELPPAPLVRQSDGNYLAEDDWGIKKHGSRWHVHLADDDSFGSYKTLGEAREQVELQREILATPFGGEAEEAVEGVARATPEEVAPTPEAAAPSEPVAAAPTPKKPKQPRAPKGWKKEGDIEVGPDGWTVEPYQGAAPYVPEYTRPGHLEPAQQGPRLPAGDTTTREGAALRLYGDPARKIPSLQERVSAAASAARLSKKNKTLAQQVTTLREELAELQAKFAAGGEFEGTGTDQIRYLAVHPEDDTLRGRSFTTSRDAKLAVQELQRKRAYRESLDAYRDRITKREFGVVDPVRAYEYTGGRRTVEEAPALPPEVAAANRARAAAAPNQPPLPSRMAKPEPQWEPTPEGAAVLATRPEPRESAAAVAKRKKYDDDFEMWQELKRKAQDPTLTEAERNKAARTAKSLGGKFTQKQGEHYSRHAAEQVLIDKLDYENKLLLDKDVQAAILKVKGEEEKAARQVEAMVYTKQNNPLTGEAEYTRLPSGSQTGFGEDIERKAVPIEVPTQGEVPVGPRPGMGPEPEWRSTYAPGERDAERALIEQGRPDIMPSELQTQYDDLTMQRFEIKDRIDAAVRNENELSRLKRAADDAFNSPEMKASEAAVLEAKHAKVRAEMDYNEGTIVGAAQAFEDAKRNLKRVNEAQTDARQAWMEADRAYKQALGERKAYEDVVNRVGTLEKAIYESATGETGFQVVDAVRAGEQPKVGKLSQKAQRFVQELQRAVIEVQEFEDAGLQFLTPNQHRDLAGNLIAIEEAQRRLLNQAQTRQVKNLEEILPRPEMMRSTIGREGKEDLGRFGNLGRSPDIPPVRGTDQDPLVARAYAESFQPTEPKERTIWSLTEDEELQAKAVPGGRQPYEPRTERAALSDLELGAQKIEQGQENAPLRRELENISQRAEDADFNTKLEIDTTRLKNEADRDEKLLPLQQQLQTLISTKEALDNKAKLVPKRDAAEAQRKLVVNTKLTGKKADHVRAIDDIGKVAKQNPDLLDDDLAVTEALLHDSNEIAQDLIDKDLTVKQVQGVIDKVGNKDDGTLDIMLTTVGRNWKMLYEANGGKKAVLKEGDIVVQQDLHKMFENLYEVSKDKVLFGRTLNAFTNLFKTYATLTPGFHIRNAISAIFMNATDGVALKTQLKGAQLWREYMKAPDGEEWLASQSRQIQDAFDAAMGTGAGGRFTEAGFAEMAESGKWNDWLERAARNKVTRLSQRAGQRVEGSVRLAMALDSMALGESVESAIQRINRIHFDYGEVSRLDENMKRLIPFWTFMSRNMPMQVSQMWTHPQVYLGYERFVNNFSAQNEEYTPSYWTKAGAWNTGLKVPGLPEKFGGGLPIYMSPDLGYTRLESDLKDMEDFLSWERPGGILSTGNPLLTAPAELAFRKDIFTGQSFEPGETVPMEGPVGLPVKLAAMLTRQTKDGEVDAAFANFIRALNPLQDRSIRMLPQFSGSDPEIIKRQPESWARTGLGLPVRTLTPKQQDNEYFRRYYDQLDAEKLRRDREERKAG